MDELPSNFLIRTVPVRKTQGEGGCFYDDIDRMFFESVSQWHNDQTKLDHNLAFRSKKELLKICREGEMFVVIDSNSEAIIAAAYLEPDDKSKELKELKEPKEPKELKELKERKEYIFGGLVVDIHSQCNTSQISTALVSYMIAYFGLAEGVIFDEAKKIVSFIKKGNKKPLRLLRDFRFKKKECWDAINDRDANEYNKYGSTRLDTIQETISLLEVTLKQGVYEFNIIGSSPRDVVENLKKSLNEIEKSGILT